MTNRKLNLFAVIFGVCVATLIYAVLVHGGMTNQPPQKPHIATLPKMSSCLTTLSIQSAFFRNTIPNSESTELVLQLLNNSDTSIIAVSIEWASKNTHIEHSLVTSSFGADTPEILAAPHSLYEVTIPVNNIPPDAELRVGSVVYADGRDDGCTGSLRDLRELKSKREAKAALKDSRIAAMVGTLIDD